MLKVDLHTHTSEDPHDQLDFSAKDLIRKAASLNYDVLSITHHWSCYFNDDIRSYAKKQGILLIPGMEAQLFPKVHMVVLGKVFKKNISTFEQLEQLKRSGNLFVIAPHPFYPIKSAINKRFFSHVELIDAMEHVNLYTSWFNPNKKMLEVAKKYNKPIVGNSDVHELSLFGHTYSIIDADKNQDDIFEAIRKNKVKVVSSPYSTKEIIGHAAKFIFHPRHLRHKGKVEDFS